MWYCRLVSKHTKLSRDKRSSITSARVRRMWRKNKLRPQILYVCKMHCVVCTFTVDSVKICCDLLWLFSHRDWNYVEYDAGKHNIPQHINRYAWRHHTCTCVIMCVTFTSARNHKRFLVQSFHLYSFSIGVSIAFKNFLQSNSTLIDE